MTSKEFCTWLSGYFEIGFANSGTMVSLSENEIHKIYEKLQTVSDSPSDSPYDITQSLTSIDASIEVLTDIMRSVRDQ